MRTWMTRTLPAVAVIVAAGLGGFFAYHWVEPRAAALPGAPLPAAAPPVPAVLQSLERPARGGDAAPSETQASPEQAIPDTLPDAAFADRSGVVRRLSDWKGHPLLVNFWATWCAPCREETPLLERLSRGHAREGLEVLGIAVDSRAAVLDYARREAIQYPLLIGEEPGLKLIHALGMQAVFPFSVFVDARGRIVTVKIGVLRADQARLILDRVEELDRGRIGLATARREIGDGIAKLALAHAAPQVSEVRRPRL